MNKPNHQVLWQVLSLHFEGQITSNIILLLYVSLVNKTNLRFLICFLVRLRPWSDVEADGNPKVLLRVLRPLIRLV